MRGVMLHAASQNFIYTHACVLIYLPFLQVHDYEFSYYIFIQFCSQRLAFRNILKTFQRKR